MPATRKAATKLEESLALLSDPHLYRYFDHLMALTGSSGTPTDLASFILDIETRIHGNRKKVEAANRLPETWQKKRRLVAAFAGRDLPATAPRADAVRKRRYAWFPPIKKEADVEVTATLASLSDLATKLGVKRATKLGQYRPGVARNFADPSPRHTVCMDGTWLTPYSRAKVWVDPEGNKHMLNSRAQDLGSVREQRVVNTGMKDNNSRRVIGINHVVGITRTKYGRVFLGVERALGWEGAAALDLTERIITHTGGHLHSLTYDKLFHGWPVEWLAAKHGVQVVVPAKAKKSKPTDEELEDATRAEQDLRAHEANRVQQLDAEAALRRTGHHRAADGNVTRVTGIHQAGTGRAKKTKKTKPKKPTKDQIQTLAAARQAVRHDLPGLIATVEQGLPTGAGLPLGTSHYVSSRKRLVTVQSRHAFYTDLDHETRPGQTCRHSIHVDDGAFWEADWQGGQWVKRQRVTCLDSRPVTDRHKGWYHIIGTHQLICHHSGEVLEFTTDFTPRPLRRQAEDNEKSTRSNQQKALALMQPVARCDATYRRAYGLRNDIESWFSDLKNRLLDDKRAASLDLNHQLLDVLYTGIVTNALALRTYRYES